MIWGASFVAIEIALEGVGPVTLALARTAVAAIALSALALATGRGLPRGGRIWLFAACVAALSNALPFCLLNWGQTQVTAGLAAVFMATQPLMSLALSHFLVAGERFTLRQALGMAAGVAGVALLVGPEAARGAGAPALAQAAVLATVFLYACGSVAAKRAPPCHPVSFGAAAMILAASMLAPAALWAEGAAAALDPAPVAAMLWLGLLSTALAQVLILEVLQRAGPPFLSLVNFMVPVWTMLFGAALLGERPEGRMAAALALILAGVALGRGPSRAAAGAPPSAGTMSP